MVCVGSKKTELEFPLGIVNDTTWLLNCITETLFVVTTGAGGIGAITEVIPSGLKLTEYERYE